MPFFQVEQDDLDVLPDEGGRRELFQLGGFGVGLVGAAEEDF